MIAFGCRDGAFDRLHEGGTISHDMVRGHQQQNAVGIFIGDHQGCDGCGRCGVAPDRLQDDGLRRDCCLTHLLGDQETVFDIADDQRRLKVLVLHAQNGVLDQAVLSGQGQQLLGKEAA